MIRSFGIARCSDGLRSGAAKTRSTDSAKLAIDRKRGLRAGGIAHLGKERERGGLAVEEANAAKNRDDGKRKPRSNVAEDDQEDDKVGIRGAKSWWMRSGGVVVISIQALRSRRPTSIAARIS